MLLCTFAQTATIYLSLCELARSALNTEYLMVNKGDVYTLQLVQNAAAKLLSETKKGAPL